MKKSLLIQNSLLSDVVMDIHTTSKEILSAKAIASKPLMQQKSMVQHLMSQK